MTTVSRADLHRAVDQLPEDRLAAAADLLQALGAQDRRVHAWRAGLTAAEEADITASLGRDYPAGEWVTDEALEKWLDDPAPQSPSP